MTLAALRPAARTPVRAQRVRHRLPAWIAVYVLAQVLFLLVLRRLAPRFFWLDDQQVQFLPTYHWFGRNLVDGRPPLMSPELGNAGNFVADPQYGVYDPAHWVLSALLSRAQDLNDAAWVMSSSCVLLLGLGVVAVLTHYRCSPAVAVAAALGLSSTGFFLWFGSSYWPLLLSTAWLPWLWYGLATSSRRGVLVTGVSAYFLVVAGYPYNLLFAGLTVLGQAGERWLHGGGAALLARDALVRAAAGAAGVVAGLPTLLSALQMVPFATRDFDVGALGNPGTFTPNLLDALVGGSTLTPLVSSYWDGNLVLAPVAATAAFAVPALALVRWRDVWRRPGVATALLLFVGAAVATQTPTFVGPFRYPWRYLAEVGLYLPLLVALGLTYGLTVTRPRLAWAALLAGAQGALAVLRAPALVGWHLVAVVVALLALAGLVAATTAPRRSTALVGVAGLLLASVAGPLVGERSAVASRTRLDLAAGLPMTGQPARSLVTRPEWGTTVREFREQSLAVERDLTVWAWKDDLAAPASGWGRGVLIGNANLLADLQPGFSYAASAQAGWAARGCQDHVGQHQPLPGCVEGLLEGVPGLPGVPWVEAMSSDEVLLSEATPPELTAYFEQNWQAAGTARTYRRYLRRSPSAGRVTGTVGQVEVEHAQPAVRPAYGSSRDLDAYEVSTGPAGGALVLRIPFWPGLRASVAGEPVRVSDVDRTLTVVDLPARLERSSLRLEFRPVGESLLWPCLLLGAAGVLGATALVRPLRRPTRRLSSPSRSVAAGRG